MSMADDTSINISTTPEPPSILTKFKNLEQKLQKLRWRHRYYFYIHVSYILFMIILGGSIMYGIENIAYIDALFLATSSVCITGLYSSPMQDINYAGLSLVIVLAFLGALYLTTVPLTIGKMIRHYKRWKRYGCTNVDSSANSQQQTYCLDELTFKAHVLALTVALLAAFVIQALCFVSFGIYLTLAYGTENLFGIDPWFFSIFITITAFVNAGFSYFAAPFTTDVFANIIMGILVTTGNCYFPSIVHLIIYTMHRVSVVLKRRSKNLNPNALDMEKVTSYVLDNHHKLTIHLFPTVQTRLYVIVNIILLLSGTFVGLILEYNNPILAQYNFGQKLLIMAFNAVNTRSAGLNTVDISQFASATLILYIIMMRIKPQMWCALDEGVYNIQHINEKVDKVHVKNFSKKLNEPPVKSVDLESFTPCTSLESFGDIKSMPPQEPVTISLWTRCRHWFSTNTLSLIHKFARNTLHLLAQSNTWIVLMVFIIAAIENDKIIADPLNFNVLKILFEVISAFGNVGLSMGYPNKDPSFSGMFRTPSKLCIIFTMIHGRHRGLYGSMKDQEKLNKPTKEKEK